jgi:plasmid stability protein
MYKLQITALQIRAIHKSDAHTYKHANSEHRQTLTPLVKSNNTPGRSSCWENSLHELTVKTEDKAKPFSTQ